MTRNGKIARLPREIREQLNRRLSDGEQGGPLLAWLNALPDVSAVLAREFGGCVISKQNLCEWRAGGFAEWQARQETLDQARELAADAGEITAATSQTQSNQIRRNQRGGIAQYPMNTIFSQIFVDPILVFPYKNRVVDRKIASGGTTANLGSSPISCAARRVWPCRLWFFLYMALRIWFFNPVKNHVSQELNGFGFQVLRGQNIA